MFFNNDVTDAVKTQACIPCRWHKLSRSGFLFGFVSKNFSWMLNLCQGSIQLQKRHISCRSSSSRWCGQAPHSSSRLSEGMLRNFSLIGSKAFGSEMFLNDCVFRKNLLWLLEVSVGYIYSSQCLVVASCTDFWICVLFYWEIVFLVSFSHWDGQDKRFFIARTPLSVLKVVASETLLLPSARL